MENSQPEAQEVETETAPPSIWKRIQTTIMMVAALMISAGQFNDTKDIVSSSYESILANFTNSIQYEMLEQIHVGNSIDYVKSKVGEPHVIKRSTLNPDVLFQYYSKDKFHLTLISSDGRLVGYSVFSQEGGFAPKIPFAEKLGSSSLSDAHKETGAYSFDIGNLIYYIESQDLGKQQMFLTLIRGYVEYGASANVKHNGKRYTDPLTKFIDKLDQKTTFSENNDEIANALKQVRQGVYPNFYAITELEPAIIAEGLLTRYEFQMFTKS